MQKAVFRGVRITLTVLAITGGISSARPSLAQVDEPSTATRAELVTAEDVETRLKQLDEQQDLSDEIKNQARELYQQALSQLKTATAAEEAIANFASQIEAAPAETAAKKQARDEMAEKAPPLDEPPADTPIADLDQDLSDAIAAREAKETVYRELEAKPNRDAARLAEIPQQIQDAREQLAAAEADLAAQPPADEPAQVTAAKRTQALARRQAFALTIQSLEKERDYLEAVDELVQIERDIAAKQLAIAKDVAEQWQKLVNERRKQLAQQEAIEAARKVAQVAPAVQELAAENADLAARRAKLADVMKDTTDELKTVRELLKKTSTDFARTQEKVLAVGLSQASGELLREERRNLPPIREHRRKMQARRPVHGQAQFTIYDLNNQRSELGTLERRVDEIAATLTVQPTEALKDEIREALKTKRDYLDSIINDYNSHVRSIVELDAEEQRLIEVTREYAQFIDRRVLWIRSAYPLGSRDYQPGVDAVRWLASPDNWQGVGYDLVAAPSQQRIDWNRVGWLCFSVGFAPLLIFQRHFRRRIATIGEAAQRRGFSQFPPTLHVLLLTLLITIPWPGLLAFLGWRLGDSLFVSEFSRAISLSLLLTSAVYVSLEFLRQVCRSHGLADIHFQWPGSALILVRRHLRWLMVCGLPLVFVSVATNVQNEQPLWRSSLGRLTSVTILVMFAVFLQRVFRPAGGVFRQLFADNTGGWLYRLRYLWYPVVVASPILLALLSAVGYYETAQVLSLRLLETAWLVLTLAIVGALLNRWVLMSRRRLAFEQARQRWAAAGQDAPASHDPASIAHAQETDIDLDLASVSVQSQQLIKTSLLFLGFVAGWFIWSDVFPALKILKTISFLPFASELTLDQLVLAVVILIITYVATKDLPGLLELTVLKHLPLDPGARYATKTLGRYLMAIIGIWLAGRMVGVTWSSIQWLIAAMGIGLGFGLQEILANFVSGIILLGERPIRVGDIVTLGETTGVVTRIQMRATTITDWDRKEFIVPNKDLITGQIVNWTLSDETNRIVITVGVAYGSDTTIARELLLQVANKHPLILDDPAPIATFEGFGDSTLNLILRCYLPSLENRLPTVTELHTEIEKTLRQAGIEIAFPQQDIHVRSTDVPVKLVQQDKPSQPQDIKPRR